jgi:hypothetical protein
MSTAQTIDSEVGLEKTAASRPRINLPFIVAIAALALALARLLLAVTRYSVNLLYWDQWDFYTPLFQRASFWQIFNYQHAPHREGIGLVLDKLVLDATAWDSRAEALFMVSALLIAAVLALILKRRLFGRFHYSDGIIACLFLTLAQLEALIGEANPSYSVFPELLIMFYCLAWMIPRSALRYAFVLLVNFLLIYTGFGIFMGIVTLGVLLLDLRRSIRSKSEPFAFPLVGLLIAGLSLSAFFYHYRWDLTTGCPIPDHRFWNYPWFVSLLMSYFLGLRALILASALGAVVAFGAAAAFLSSAFRLWSKTEWSAIDRTLTILLGFSLLFAANAALGRTCQGMPEAAQFSRYMGLLVPAFFAIYLYLLTWRDIRLRLALITVFLLAVLPGTFLLPNGYSPEVVHDGKLAWKACILETGNIAYCDQVTGFPVYPVPPRTHLVEKLELLRANHLNLYSGH